MGTVLERSVSQVLHINGTGIVFLQSVLTRRRLVASGLAFLSRVGPIAAQQDASAVQVADFAFEPGTLTVLPAQP